jgi:hypothetical protein
VQDSQSVMLDLDEMKDTPELLHRALNLYLLEGGPAKQGAQEWMSANGYRPKATQTGASQPSFLSGQA